jgi:hypothetical protein
MKAARYPHPGHRIAPYALHEILDVEMPSGILENSTLRIRLCDLDETAWERFDFQVCKRLGEEVMNVVRMHIPSQTRELLNLHLPIPPNSLRLKDLSLETRTHLLLERWGFDDHVEKLGDKTLGDLLDIHGFGTKCLVDFLASLETSIVRASQEPISKAEGPRNDGENTRVLPHLERLKLGPTGVTYWSDGARGLQRTTIALKHSTPLLASMLIAEGKKLQQIPGASEISRDDPRLGHLLWAIDPEIETVGHLTDGLTSADNSYSSSKFICKKVWKLQEQITAFSQLPLEEELTQILIACSDRRSNTTRNARITIRRLGFDGEGRHTLKFVQSEFGITRERVRQISDEIIGKVRGRCIFAPVLRKAIAFISFHIPNRATEIEKRLALTGLSRKGFQLEGLIEAADILGYEVPFRIIEKNSARLVVAASDKKVVGLLTRLATKAMSHFGAATIQDISAQVAEKHQLHVDSQLVTKALEAYTGFSWLDEKSGWFWLRSTSANRLLASIKKIISVAGRIRIPELRAGLSRNYRTEGFAPPQRVLLALCQQLSWCRVENNVVIADPPIDWGVVLSGNEKVIVEVLKEHGPIMERASLEELCLRRGMNRSTFYVYIGNSLVIEKLATGIYGLLGAQVQAGEVAALSPAKKKHKVVVDSGWTEGHIWILIRLSKAVLTSGVFGCPSALRRFLSGEFSLQTADGTHVGTLVVGDTGTWGLGPFFRRRGGEVGDYLHLTFDLGERTATIGTGDSSK